MMNWSGVFHFIATWFPRKPVAYLCLCVGWLVTLWFLSAGNPVPKGGPEIPHLDKVAHFGYFFVGGALLTTWVLVAKPHFRGCRRWVLAGAVLASVVVGRLDEYHQSFTPGRSGNDTGDWIADIAGGAVGAGGVLFLVLPGVLNSRMGEE